MLYSLMHNNPFSWHSHSSGDNPPPIGLSQFLPIQSSSLLILLPPDPAPSQSCSVLLASQSSSAPHHPPTYSLEIPCNMLIYNIQPQLLCYDPPPPRSWQRDTSRISPYLHRPNNLSILFGVPILKIPLHYLHTESWYYRLSSTVDAE